MAAPNTVTTEHPIGGGQSPAYLGGPGGSIGFYQDPFGAVFTGSISGTTLTVSSLLQGSIVIGQTITSGASTGTTITALGTATAQTGAGALGTYTVSISQTVAVGTTFTSGLGAVTQPSGGAQAVGQLTSTAAGSIVKYQLAPQVNSVSATTTLEQTSTVTSGPSLSLATNSVLWVNKVANQAGLGIAGVRVSSAGTMAIQYLNVSSGAITPTQETNDIIEIRGGPLTTTASLSPAAVPANTTAEQIFTITGPVCLPGTVGIVNKPSAQTGLGYSQFARVVGTNQVGITFANTATTAITPTAAETYQFAFIPQLNAFNPTFVYTIPAAQTATNASTTTELTSAVTGILATDVVVGISKPTLQASTGVIGGRITSANAVLISYVTVLGAVTPTSSEVYNCTILRQAPLNPAMPYTATLATSAIAATTSAEVTTTVTGLVVSSSVAVVKPTVTPGLFVSNARVSAANTLAVSYTNLTTTSINVPSESYAITNVQLQGPGTGAVTTAGLSVTQSFFPAQQQTMTMAQALRSALVATNLIAGA